MKSDRHCQEIGGDLPWSPMLSLGIQEEATSELQGLTGRQKWESNEIQMVKRMGTDKKSMNPGMGQNTNGTQDNGILAITHPTLMFSAYSNVFVYSKHLAHTDSGTFRKGSEIRTRQP